VTSWNGRKVDECRGWIRPGMGRCRPIVPVSGWAILAVDRKVDTCMDSVTINVALAMSGRFDEAWFGLADRSAIRDVTFPKGVAPVRSKPAAWPWSDDRGRRIAVLWGALSLVAYDMTVSSGRGRTRLSDADRHGAPPGVPGGRDASPGLLGM
jgi:hypothetical protein